MFTGIIQEIGSVEKITPNQEGKELTISCSKTLCNQMKVDDSVAVNGCCQTVTKVNPNSFTVQAVHVTLEKTSLGNFIPGSKVNLELALRMGDRLGGHLVSGHVNTLGTITDIKTIGKNSLIWVSLPKPFQKYFVKEGSVALDGISLTIADEKWSDESYEFCVSIIPHTLKHTNLFTRDIGSKLNIEVDILSKYIERLIGGGLPRDAKSKVNWEWLASQGY